MRTCAACHRAFVDTQDACPLDDIALEDVSAGELPADVGRVLGQYRLIALLAEGGMGNVYVGAHTRLNRYVAIKLLKPELSRRHGAIARFFDEARAVNTIKHPNIVESIDLVEDVVDGAYCVLELLHGPSLKRRLADGKLPLESAVRVAAQIADALHVVHAQGIVHRDLKPDNLLLVERDGRDDFVKLIDFGVAQMGNDDAAGVPGPVIHASGLPFGTAAYMAPEQAAGERVDGRADVYALGVLLFEMITGIHPFPSKNDNEYVLRHADEAPPKPSKMHYVPRQLDAIVLRCHAKKPEDRFPSAAAVAEALRRENTPMAGSRAKVKRPRTGLVLALGGLAAAGIAAALIVPGLVADRTQTAAAAPRPAPQIIVEPRRAPETVTLTFTSEPSGAQVFRRGESVALGTTPFATQLVKSDRATHVTFALDGYEPSELDASLTTTDTIAVTLAKKPAVVIDRKARPKPKTPKSPKTEAKKPQEREGVMDPFAQKN
jgi:serine/threonine-protein kinase